jgi:predicted acetyltransferase
MYRDHMPFTYLMPAAEAIYLPFGFRIVYKHEAWSQFFHIKLQNQLKIAEFNLHSSEFLTAISLKEQDKTRIQEVVEFSNFHLSKQFDIYAYRTDYYYIRLFHEMECTGGEIVLFYDENRLIGYISYMADEGFYISECIYDSEQEDIFIRSVCNYMIQLEKKLKMEEINKINYFNPCIMARIIDFESFVSYLSAEEELNLIIQVNDSIIHENNGVFDLHFSRNGCELVKCRKEPEIAGDVSDLTRLFFGQMDHREQIKMITGKDKSLVNDRLRKINTFNKVLINDIV